MKQLPAGLRLILFLALIAASQACAGARPPVGTSPRIELTGGFNFYQVESAQFPGFMASAAFILPKTPVWGIGVVGDVEASYLVPTTTAGVRVYRRTRPLFGDERSLTGFAQVLAGEAKGEVQGILRSEGGFTFIPSIGLDYGSGTRAFHLQVGYRNVSKGAIYDPRISDEPIDDLSMLRVVVGMTWRFRAR